jgi:hypothetical protein
LGRIQAGSIPEALLIPDLLLRLRPDLLGLAAHLPCPASQGVQGNRCHQNKGSRQNQDSNFRSHFFPPSCFELHPPISKGYAREKEEWNP